MIKIDIQELIDITDIKNTRLSGKNDVTNQNKSYVKKCNSIIFDTN